MSVANSIHLTCPIGGGELRLVPVVGGDLVGGGVDAMHGGVDVGGFFFFQAEDGIRDLTVTGVQTCALPICFGDSAAVVYISWKRGLKWYSIKYVWSTEALKGAVCDQKRNLFVVQDTVVLESGGPTNVWKEEQIDPSAEFRAHFEGDVPDFVGVGLMSDGDQTLSISAADYTGFVLVH